MKTYLILLLLLCSIQRTVFAQEQRVDSLYSKVLKQSRTIQLVFPQGYDPKVKENYELLFCLDGISNAIKMETAFLQSEGFIPQNIILVGIPAVSINGISMRERDFTPTKTGPYTGGATQFLQFLKDELLPYLKQKFSVKPKGHLLYGASMAGLFTVYTFLKEPTLFTSYLAIDPSLWWDGFYMKKELESSFKQASNLDNTLWMIGREGAPYRDMGIAGVDSLLQKSAPNGLRWRSTAYADETHYSTMFKGFWEGMKFSYGGFYAAQKAYPASRRILMKPMAGIVLKDKPFPLICYNVGAAAYIRFTTNGTEPLWSSNQLSGQETPLLLSKSSKVTLKSLGVREEYNRSAMGQFTIGKVIPALKQPKGIKQGGLHFAYFKGIWDTLPDLNKLQPDSVGIASKGFELNRFNRGEGFACKMEGFLEIKTNGYYIFTKVDGNDDSKVYLNRQLILGAVQGKIAGNEESYILPLEKGFYPFRIEYLRKKGGKELQPIYIKPEGREDFPITAEMFFRS